MDGVVRPLRVFVFYPSMNLHTWTVLLPGATKHVFQTEGTAVEFALTRASAMKGKGRAVEVLRERVSGGWVLVPF
ncbi:hypothetical protein [Luteibacter sp. dw_328]|jgi:hypothetical protein|uniref:hypothetical protein n=1 Tax=Luteibacter sp. dw_328 TaxID=2719796 RepID=UPI000D359230|nr:hypothetical protein [Luteibacter sp. dw_328]PTR33177.1 hypothetical protein C8J98_104397 [Luteibacter sp. OK325]